jgi:methylmalonyl-CoA/ethylmalonyl-CoA epimerase
VTILDIDHVAIAVNDLEEAGERYEPLLETSTHVIEHDPQDARIAVYQLENSRVELLEPMTEESSLVDFLSDRGEGLHHVALRTDNVDEELDRVSTMEDVTCIDDHPREGAEDYEIAFLHPKSFNGALLELAEPPQ